MEVHSAPAAAKRMWGYLRAVFFMVRKGVLANKRKLLVSMHVLMKRRNKAVARTVANLLSHHHHHHHYALRRREYEFSCSNSPDPSAEEGYVAWPAPLGRLEYAASNSPEPRRASIEYDAPGEESFSVRVSNYSSEEDEGAGSQAVDHDAEEFIRRFYDQLRRQNHVAMLPCMQESAA